MNKYLIFFLVLFVNFAGLAQAQTLYLGHSQIVPKGLDEKVLAQVESTLVEGVYGIFFDKGLVAFDNPEGQFPDSNILIGDAKQFGADKALSFCLKWQKQQDGSAHLLSLDYLAVNQVGQVMLQGSLTQDLDVPSFDQDKKINLLKGKLVQVFQDF